jgi:N-acetylmuramoyl-L-alanine amidase
MSFLEGLLWLTLNIYHESRGEPEIGQLAVAHVTLNMAVEQQRSVSEIVNEPYQFSWTFQKDSYLPDDFSALQQSASMALKALTTPDFTNGATFYHHVTVSPEWAKEMKFIIKYGSHNFYRKDK